MAAGGNHWMPLFPLEAVLLPGAVLPLHIFEPRYRAVVARCETESIPFGLVLAQEQKLSRVGCEAWISEILQRYPDGRSDLLARGGGRFRLLEVREHSDGYLEGRVSAIQDAPEGEDLPARQTLLHLYREVQRINASEEGEEMANQAETGASAGEPGYTFPLAASIPMELRERQALLETTSERDRERILIYRLAQLVPAAQQAVENRRRARGNGKLKLEP